jgi:5-methyltetrahydrofolate--homocysteine methyltransferase
MAKIQCDISAMISPAMYKDFMVPALETMTRRLDYCIYHWDGPGALPHHDHLLAIERIPMIQWTPGAAAEPVMDRRWWPYYHKTIDAGKKVLLLEYKGVENLRALRDEFGPKFKQFMIGMRAESKREADEIMRMVCV